MSTSGPPTLATGKICYIEIPATDLDGSVAFYREAFGWHIRRRGDGSIAFDDAVSEVSGTFVLDRSPATDPGLMIYIMVADAEAATQGVMAAGGEIVVPVDPAAREQVATFRDPAGNVLGIYQQPGLAERESGVTGVPEHLRSVTPRMVFSDGAAAIDFYRRAFGAEEVGEPFTGPDGELIHAEVRIGDSIVAITDEGADSGPARAPESVGGVVTTIISTYWNDVTGAWDRAVEAGAEVIYPLADQFYGERGGRLRDPFGHQWMLSQRIENVTHEEIVARAQKMYSGAAGS
ncbi:MAG TPA: VOC family protein [Solirubrobacteraceae bacterium]|nr:VOC family protein [Solirubrobacteraceae bacterium]